MSQRRSIPKDKLQKIILTGIVTIAVLAIMYLLWIAPNFEVIANNKITITTLENEIQELNRKATVTTANQPMLKQVQGFVESLRERTVSGDPYMWLVLQVNELVEHRPVKAPTPRPGGREGHPRVAGYEMLATTLELEGAYDQIGLLIRDFENLYPLGEVKSIDMTPVESSSACRAVVETRFLLWPEDKLKVKVENGKKP